MIPGLDSREISIEKVYHSHFEISQKMVTTSQVDEISWQLLLRTHEISLLIMRFNKISSKMVTKLKMRLIDDY